MKRYLGATYRHFGKPDTVLIELSVLVHQTWVKRLRQHPKARGQSVHGRQVRQLEPFLQSNRLS